MLDRVDSVWAGNLTLQQLLFARAERLTAYLTSKIPPRLARLISLDDILQEVWFAAFRSFSAFRWEHAGSFDHWLMAITKRKLIDAIRRAERERRGGRLPTLAIAAPSGGADSGRAKSFESLFELVAAPGQTPSRVLSAQEAEAALRHALSELPADQFAVIKLRHLEGWPLERIADQMRLPLYAVRQLLGSGLRGLRRRLGHAEKYFSDAGPPRARTGSGVDSE